VRRFLRCRKGSTLIGLMVVLAILSLSATVAGTDWKVLRRQEREKELLWRGDQYRRAIASYYERSDVGNSKQYPPDLKALLEDGRGLVKKKHIRRLYDDPMTGGKWEIIPGPAGGVMGVRSRSTLRPFKEDGFSPEEKGFAGAKSYIDWRFQYGQDSASGQTPSATTARP
jgi:type II secretory pathway pseudopilin PulG